MRRLTGLALLLALCPLGSASAQSARLDEAVATVQSHFRQQAARFGVSTADLAAFDVSRAYVGRRSGVAHVYLRQQHAGIPVFNARASAHVAADGELYGVHERFAADLAARANDPTPALSAEAAGVAAAAHLTRTAEAWLPTPTAFSDAPGEGEIALPADYLAARDEQAKLYYFVTEAGPVRLAWDVEVRSRDESYLWTLRVDAHTGDVLDTTDHVNHDHWGVAAHRPVSMPPVATPALTAALPAASGSYRVIEMPCESPAHCERTLAATPHDPAASQLGWHNDSFSNYTITRGNNAFAFEDRDDNGVGLSPDGGAGLVFDFPFVDLTLPNTYIPAAVTNLFYWNNIVHDVFWHYGFDEAAGNFQVTNFGLGGFGNDPVRAIAQNRADLNPCPTGLICVNNAQFGTPNEGSSPTMRMYEWVGGAPPEFSITAPPAIAGPYDSGGAQFGVYNLTVSNEIVLAEDDAGPTSCGPIQSDVTGKIALIERGGCDFQVKARNAQEAGAIGVIIHNCLPADNPAACTGTNPGEVILTMAGSAGAPNDITIPAIFVLRSTGLAMRANMPGVTGTMELGPGGRRDSDFDAGIIAHEYGHGITNRLTGTGPGCLNNQEQMGEGWGDYFGMMLTQRPGDTAGQPRGVGTYVSFEGNDDVGIRPAPYSTDFAVNDYTYGDKTNAEVTIPHGIGFIWATMVWEMTWDLIAAHGFDPDIYDANGTAGNQVALALVVEGVALQPCSPGFVDGRDAILAADQALYGGAHNEIIWRAFARRGLGFSASQGSSASVADGNEAFDLPPGLAAEPGTETPATYHLSQAYPNPFNPSAQFTLELSAPQTVRVELFDALGRSVALLHDGQLAAGSTQFTIDGAGLASGLYLYRVTGTTFSETRRVTLMK